ncbi:MAG: hypothetical protein GF364_07880 [Candidatus Lokiarchaeota archaeon]|nr:hypothetical protein [Candidatus Lokiarchaeota archaeon]
MTENKLTHKCKTCGAVIKISPEDLVITCQYCGETYDVDFEKIPGHKMLPTQDKRTIKENVIAFLDKNRTDPDLATITEIRANYLPYWVVPFNSHTHYYGVERGSVTRYRTKTRRVKDANGNVRTETYKEPYQVTVWRPREGDFNRNGKENIIARKHTAFYGFNEFERTLYLDNIIDFEYDKIEAAESDFINAEVDAHEAKMDAYGKIENDNRAQAASGLHKLVRCDSDIQTGDPLYVHAPLWEVRYTFENKVFKVSAAGDSGKVVKGEIPLTLKRRILNYIIGMLLIVIFGIIGNVGLGMTNVADTETTGIILLIVSVIAMGFSVLPLKNAFSIQLEKSMEKDIHKDRKKKLKARRKALKKGDK